MAEPMLTPKLAVRESERQRRFWVERGAWHLLWPSESQ